MMTQKVNERFDRLYGEVIPYVTKVCLGFSRNLSALAADDLRQECAIKLLHIVKRYQHLPDSEVVGIFKRSLYNLLRDIVVKETKRLTTTSYDMDDFEDPYASASDSMTARDQAIDILEMLDEGLDRELFTLLLDPDMALLELMEEAQRKAERRKASGKLVMRAEIVHVTFRIYATRLAVSPATISRALARIRTKARRALGYPASRAPQTRK